jgi:hypothetical protein
MSSTVAIETPPVEGTLFITLQYSCGVGNLAPPSKKYWGSNGALHSLFKIPVEDFPPSISTQKNVPYEFNFSLFDTIIGVGDSLMGNLMLYSNKELGGVRRPNFHFKTKFRHAFV